MIAVDPVLVMRAEWLLEELVEASKSDAHAREIQIPSSANGVNPHVGLDLSEESPRAREES